VHTQLLIDDLVRQTTVLIAQLSTAAGSRSPLSQIAEQVFLELSRELESQGVRQKVVADMFGLALRSYQLKKKRANESAESNAGTLWQDLFDDLAQNSETRQELERRHRSHSPRQIGATLQDMVKSGLAYSSGQGPDTRFGLTSENDRKRLGQKEGERALSNMVWYLAASGAANTREQIAKQVRVDDAAFDQALESLLAEGRLTQDGELMRAQRFEIGVGSEQGWETAVCDHFRAVATAIAAKVSRPTSNDADEVGGGTLSFRVNPKHPFAADVYSLLRETRERANALWSKVATHNDAHPPHDDDDRVTFYFGQNVVRGTKDVGVAVSTGVDSAEGAAEVQS
jgi:hypothetical protein